MANRTEQIITRTLLLLLEEKPLDKITVKDIVEACGINRNTFYYHFSDIPSALTVALSQEIEKHLEPKTYSSVTDAFLEAINYLEQHRRMMYNVYRSIHRDTLINYARVFVSQSMIRCREKESPQPSGDMVTDTELVSYFLQCLFTGLVIDWMENQMNYDLRTRVEELAAFLQGSKIVRF